MGRLGRVALRWANPLVKQVPEDYDFTYPFVRAILIEESGEHLQPYHRQKKLFRHKTNSTGDKGFWEFMLRLSPM